MHVEGNLKVALQYHVKSKKPLMWTTIIWSQSHGECHKMPVHAPSVSWRELQCTDFPQPANERSERGRLAGELTKRRCSTAAFLWKGGETGDLVLMVLFVDIHFALPGHITLILSNLPFLLLYLSCSDQSVSWRAVPIEMPLLLIKLLLSSFG